MASLRRGFSEFLKVPIAVMLVFLLLAIGVDFLDRSRVHWIIELRHGIQSHLFGKAQGTRALMGSIASGIITMTSITISVLLVAVQQSSNILTPLVFDQFLRRRQNQIYFGCFIGLAIYSLLVLASVDSPFIPVLGATMTLLLTIGALVLMVVLLYSTINQMRPAEIIENIHDHILNAEEKRRDLLAWTRRSPALREGYRQELRATRDGFVTELNLHLIHSYCAQAKGLRFEITYSVSVGTYVACNDPLGEICCQSSESAEALQRLALRAIHLQKQRDLTRDPAYGIEQLQTIAWTSISSAKQNQHPGLLCIRSLRDVLSRWGGSRDGRDQRKEPLPVVYNDRLMDDLLNSFEALATITSESLQEQCFTEVLISVSSCFTRMSRPIQERLVDIVLRILSSLGDHVLTLPLEEQLLRVEDLFGRGEWKDAARAVGEAREKLKASVGKLGSRATRAAA